MNQEHPPRGREKRPSADKEPAAVSPATAATTATAGRLRQLEDENEKLRLLLETTRELAEERNLDLLIARVVERTSRVMNCERSSVFLLDREKNELYSLRAQGLDAEEIRFSVFAGLAGYAARMGEAVRISDAYADERFNQEVDRATGYRTRAVLCLPLHDRRGRVMGAIQCLNKLTPAGKAAVFDRTDEELLGAFAAQAAIFLENAALRREMDRLFEAVVSTIGRAIDDRDPCTSGHSLRVTHAALKLARAVHEADRPPFDEIRYTRARLRRLRYAGLLHDVGKIGVREHILCKKNKLSDAELEAVRARFRAAAEKLRAETLSAAWPRAAGTTAEKVLTARCAPAAKELEAALALVERVNVPGFMSDEDAAALTALKEKGLLSDKEHESLAVRRGNLTPREWEDMKSHAARSRTLLEEIPWPPPQADLPRIAAGHHEKPDGSGYPEGLAGARVPFDALVLGVADIYDGLTASDRPYKKAVPHDKARAILEDEAVKGRLPAPLVQLFFDAKCYTPAGA